MPDERAWCEEHLCPMVDVDGEEVCVLGWADLHLAQKQIVDLIPSAKGGVGSLVFDDGHTIDTLCHYCGGPLDPDHLYDDFDIDTFLDEASGLYLVMIVYVEAYEAEDEFDEDDPEHLVLCFWDEPEVPFELEDVEAWEYLYLLPVHVDSVKTIQCPAEA